MIVDLVFQSGGTSLVEPFELIEAYGVAIWHEEAMEGNGQAALPERVNLLGFTEDLAPGWNEKVLAIVGIDIIGHQATDRSSEAAVEPVNEQGFDDRVLEKNVFLAAGGIRDGRR